MVAGAALVDDGLDPTALAQGTCEALAMTARLRRDQPELRSWINIAVLNGSGDRDDLSLRRYSGPPRPTAHARRLPVVLDTVERLRSRGIAVTHARVAVLLSRDVLRCHVDMHPSIRLVAPLNRQGTDFRHLFGEQVICLEPGEVWLVNGGVCHGAAHVGHDGQRVALLIDALPGPCDAALADWWIPPERTVRREPWSVAARADHRRAFDATRAREGLDRAEHDWHLLPFEYELRPEAAYGELIALFEDKARTADSTDEAGHWRERADHWNAHTCVCVA